MSQGSISNNIKPAKEGGLVAFRFLAGLDTTAGNDLSTRLRFARKNGGYNASGYDWSVDLKTITSST